MNGAKPKQDDGTEGQADGESSDDSEASKTIDKVLASGNKLAGGKAEVCPKENTQKPTTSEGTVSVGAALGLLLANGTTGATLNQSVSATGDVTVLVESEKDLVLNSDASATNSDTGVGVAVGILVENSKSVLTIGSDVAYINGKDITLIRRYITGGFGVELGK